MKVLQVIHGFPPANIGGSELYTYHLARGLALEDEIYVFHRIDDRNLKEYELISKNFDGLRVYAINNTFKYCESFEEAYKNDVIASKFGRLLDQIQPDVVHIGHLATLSTTLISEVKKRNIPLVFTLHDFWLFCHLGRLLKPDLTLCGGPEPTECVSCLALKIAAKRSVRKIVEVMKRKAPSIGNESPLGRILEKIYRLYSQAFVLLKKEDANNQIIKRMAHLQDMCGLVDRFIAPSNFLLEKAVEFGIARHKITYCTHGFETRLFNHYFRKNSSKIRFGYVGTLIPPKGVHVLLQAFNQIKGQNCELRIHGMSLPSDFGDNEYPQYLQSLVKKENVFWFGKFDNKNIARILSDIDILVVPSIWYENSPLVIHEAFMAALPIITTNIGGMSELIQDGVNGLLFNVGDPEDLATKMQMVIDNQSIIDRFKKNIPPVSSIKEHALRIREIYLYLIKDRCLESNKLTHM
jgi:glycosyltransferase involved in cell wall biosynthesis